MTTRQDGSREAGPNHRENGGEVITKFSQRKEKCYKETEIT